MIRLALPGKLELCCPNCHGHFSVPSAELSGRTCLTCPFCNHNNEVFNYLGLALRRKVYQAIRNHCEERVYEQQQIDAADYFEDSSNIR